MSQARDIPVAPDAKHVKLRLTPEEILKLRKIAHAADIRLAAVCRLAMDLLARGDYSPKRLIDEAVRIRTETQKAREEGGSS